MFEKKKQSTATSNAAALKYLKTRLESMKRDNETSQELNKKARQLLSGLESGPKLTKAPPAPPRNNEKLNLLKLQRNYAKHSQYWQQIWLFTDNPVFEIGDPANQSGFENPFYDLWNESLDDSSSLKEKSLYDLFAELNTKLDQEQLRQERSNYYYLCQIDSPFSIGSLESFSIGFPKNSSSAMDIYESIPDLDQSQSLIQPSSSTSTSSISSSAQAVDSDGILKYNKRGMFPSELEISSPESNDSGIHSEHDILNRHVEAKSISQSSSCQEKTPTSTTVDSLYSSIVSSKKSYENLAKDASADFSFNDNTRDESGAGLDEADDPNIVHLEQHELPLGWIRCCDEDGIYYWHKPSGTVTRRPPAIPPPALPKKNFDVNHFESHLASKPTASILTLEGNDKLSTLLNKLSISATAVAKSNVQHRSESEMNKSEMTVKQASPDSSSSKSYSSSATSTTSSSTSSSRHNVNEERDLSEATPSHRFFVRSLGWVRIDENDLTPERSSKAVNKCINDLSRGTRDLNDAVARWGEGKDMLMDIVDNYLLLRDTYDEKLLNKQCITSIRVWGVGRDNGRDFAYVARDKHTKVHMCHVFRCDSVPAKEIANSLKDACRRILKEKKESGLNKSKSGNSKLKRPTNLPDLKHDAKYSKEESVAPLSTSNSFDTNVVKLSYQFPTPIEEPKKSVRCRYLGHMIVNRASGMVVLNGAIEKIYSNAVEDYRKQMAKQGLFDLDKNLHSRLGVDAEVNVSPSSLVVRHLDTNEQLFECRIRYLSFLGVSTDAKLCGFIMQCADNTFKCHGFLCQNSAGQLCKLIEAACRLRYQKCLDAHLETETEKETSNEKQGAIDRFSFLGTQIKNVFDSLKNRYMFNSSNEGGMLS